MIIYKKNYKKYKINIQYINFNLNYNKLYIRLINELFINYFSIFNQTTRFINQIISDINFKFFKLTNNDYTNSSYNILQYKNITGPFVKYIIYYNKIFIKNKNLKILNFQNTLAFLEALLYLKINNFEYKFIRLFNNSHKQETINGIYKQKEELEERYNTKIVMNDNYLDKKMSINNIDKLISEETTLYNIIDYSVSIYNFYYNLNLNKNDFNYHNLD